MFFIKAIFRVFSQPVIIGKKYLFVENKNPFENNHWVVKVIEIKKGYVKYERTWSTADFLRFDSLDKQSFNFCYKLLKDQNDN